MLLFLSITGVFLSGLLIYFNVRKYPISVYLGIFFFLISWYAFTQYSMMYAHSKFLVSIVFVHFGIPIYLIGPAFYLYIRSVLNDNPRLTKKDLWHLLPMVMYVIIEIPYFLLPWAYKTDIAARLAQNFNNISHLEFFPMFNLTLARIIYLSRPLLALGYLTWSFVIFLKYLRQNPVPGLFISQHFMKKWISVLFGSLFILTSSHLIMILQSFEESNAMVFYTLNTLQILSGTSLTGLIVSPFFFPQILYGLPRIPEKARPSVKPDRNQPGILHCDISNNKHEFEHDYMQSIQLKVGSSMQELQPYLRAECNLFHFSKLTKIPAHHLSYYFREIRKQPFNDFRNEWRIKHAKKLILDGSHADLTLEAVGMLSGFTSRNTFFRSFKKVEGITPGEFASKLKS